MTKSLASDQIEPLYRLLRQSVLAILVCAVLVVVCYYFVDRQVAYFVHDHEIAKVEEFRWLTEPPPLVQSWSPLLLIAPLCGDLSGRGGVGSTCCFLRA